ncbi:MAG TPA: ATP-binding protein [Flavobacterium sp.]|jgi:signal transduction histidine kinase|nr:ATP-binding protein [Flavobacterium sp.]
MNNRPKILIVDDKDENLRALEIVLRELDVDLIRATSGNEALKATLHHDFSLALLDVQMPDMDGYELAAFLREEEKTSRLPFIFISAVYTDNPAIFKGYEKGAFSFITKPFQPEILRNKVSFFIEKYQQELALSRINEELETKNAELRISNNELESFSYSVSHDLMAPVRAVRIYTEMLQQGYNDALDEQGQKVLAKIQNNAEKMAQLIEDLLEFSQLGKKELNRARVDMAMIANEVIAEVAEFTPLKSSIRMYELAPAYGDPALLRQVWMNLISNAVKYSEHVADSAVEIGSVNTEDGVTYFVRDNGVGFDMAQSSKLFGVFQRLHSASDFKGTGIGLAIVHRIIMKHNGKVWAESVIDKGSTFYFQLPEMKPDLCLQFKLK